MTRQQRFRTTLAAVTAYALLPLAYSMSHQPARRPTRAGASVAAESPAWSEPGQRRADTDWYRPALDDGGRGYEAEGGAA